MGRRRHTVECQRRGTSQRGSTDFLAGLAREDPGMQECRVSAAVRCSRCFTRRRECTLRACDSSLFRRSALVKLFQGVRPFKRAAAVRDALAGFTLAAMDIPQVLGYTKIAGMPLVSGLYSLLLARGCV